MNCFHSFCNSWETANSIESQTADSKASRFASSCSKSWTASGLGSPKNPIWKPNVEIQPSSRGHHFRYLIIFVVKSLGSWSLSRSSGMLLVKSSKICERPRPRASVELTREAMVLKVSLRTNAIHYSGYPGPLTKPNAFHHNAHQF